MYIVECRPKVSQAIPSFPLSANQLFELVTRFPLSVPFISKEDIKDRNKADAFTKLFAVGQSAWLVIQCTARKVVGLPFSQLELATIGFVCCATAMYSLQWDKPFDVERPVVIECPIQYHDEALQILRGMFGGRYKSKFLSFTCDQFITMKRIPNQAYLDDLGLGQPAWLLGVLSTMSLGAAFSALHIVAWNQDFPSPVERFMWRIAGSGAAVACVLVATLLPFMGTGSKWWQLLTVILVVMPLRALYMVARGILLVQVVISLRKMPVGVYQDVPWPSYIPYVS